MDKTNVTANELTVLKAIRASEYQSNGIGEGCIGHPVYIQFLRCVITSNALSGVISSLNKKGLAVSSKMDGDDLIELTEIGYKATL